MEIVLSNSPKKVIPSNNIGPDIKDTRKLKIRNKKLGVEVMSSSTQSILKFIKDCHKKGYLASNFITLWFP